MNHTVSPAQVYALAGGILQSCLKLTDHGPKCTARNLLLILFFAAARAGSIFDACRRLCDSPSDQAVRNALGAMLPKRMNTMERRLNQALTAKLPKGLLGRSYPMAIDASEICYYGKPQRDPRELRRGKRKAGTSRFHCYATHEMKSPKQKATVSIAVVQRRGREGERRQPMVFCFWGFHPGSPRGAAQTYRSRYGIETSYRQMNQGRIRTCMRDPILRLLLVGIALVLRNLWVWLHRTMLGHPRGSSIELRLELLRLRTMLLMLQRCAEECLGCVETGASSASLQNPACT
jgi:putative transposase